MTGERFDGIHYYSNSFDVFTWADDEDGPQYVVVASFSTAEDARTFITNEPERARELFLRPPAQHIRLATEYLAAMHK